MSELVLERRDDPPQEELLEAGGGLIALTPPLDEDFWEYRVRLSDTQAILGFPKFFTIGIGFAQEEDWNTNLPYLVATEEIFGHIIHNKGDDSISDDDVRQAIRMVQEAAVSDHGGEIGEI